MSGEAVGTLTAEAVENELRRRADIVPMGDRFITGPLKGASVHNVLMYAARTVEQIRKARSTEDDASAVFYHSEDERSAPAEPETMRLDSTPGDKLIFSFPGNGWPHDQAHVRKHLVVGEAYTLRGITMHDLWTEIALEGLVGLRFNSVHFSNAPPEKPVEAP